MVGVARYIRSPDRLDAAEVAITVADEWQGRGVGTTLLRRLARRARAAGIGAFVATCLAGNKEIIELLEELGPTARRSGGEDVTLEIELGIGAESAMRPSLRAVASNGSPKAAS
jgi:GNAT superfamily N-acetyltransferase